MRLPRRFRHVVRGDEFADAIIYLVALLVLVGVGAMILIGGIPGFS